MDPDTTFSSGQTWSALNDQRHIEVVSYNAFGEVLVGYQGETGTAQVTEAEFAAWVREEEAKRV